MTNLSTRRTYLFALVDGGGNVPPELGAVRRLVERGHTVTVLTEDSVVEDVRATGAQPRRWTRAPNRPDRRPENDPIRDWECRYPWQLVERMAERQFIGPAERYMEDVREAIAEARPDLVVSSMFSLGAMIAAEAEGVPFDVLFPNVYLLPAPELPAFGLGLRPARSALGRARDRVVNRTTEALWDRNGLRQLNELRARLGLPQLAHVLDQVRRARRQIVLTSRQFDFPWDPPATVRYVGPVLDDPVWTGGGSWAPAAGDVPLVLVGMSSTFQDQASSLQRVLDALAQEPVRMLVTTGPALDPAALRAPGKMTVLRSAPHGQVLAHASLVVTHGGHGTVMKALAAGVPLLVMPHGRDQDDTAARVAARGAGLIVKRTASPATIARAARALLSEPSYRAAAARLGEAIRRDARGDALVRALEDLSRADGRARHTSSTPARLS